MSVCLLWGPLPQSTWGGQRTFGGQFSPSTMWILEIGFRWSGLVASALPMSQGTLKLFVLFYFHPHLQWEGKEELHGSYPGSQLGMRVSFPWICHCAVPFTKHVAWNGAHRGSHLWFPHNDHSVLCGCGCSSWKSACRHACHYQSLGPFQLTANMAVREKTHHRRGFTLVPHTRGSASSSCTLQLRGGGHS